MKKKTSNRKSLNSIDKAFSISLEEMRKIIKDFHLEMVKRLSGEKGSLKMIPTYVDRPTGDEKGKFIALDLGGTNFRILELELKGNGKSTIRAVKKFVLDKRYITGRSEDFFAFLAESIKIFLEEEGIEEKRNLGFTFSFPVRQIGIAAGTLARWTKGFDIKEVVGKDIVELFNEALAKKGLNNIKIRALVNDTVGTLVARAYEDHDCDAGVILGTGTNACYLEDLSEIAKWKEPETRSGRMIVNIEWGNFNKLRLTTYDKQLDEISDNPGQQILEKMVSGMYLGELLRVILKGLIRRKILFRGGIDSSAFDKRNAFKSEYMSIVESDHSDNLPKVNNLLKIFGIKDSVLEDRRLIKKICELVSLRAARISAASMAAIITKIDPNLSRKHTIAIDGAVYEKHPGFSNNIKYALKELFRKKASNIKLTLTKDGSGKGAAIIAAVATSL